MEEVKKNYNKREFIERLRDPKFYVENFFKINLKEGGFGPFVLKPAQIDIFNTMRKYNRIMIAKARQIGQSSAISAFLYHKAIMNPGVKTALIGYNSDLTEELLEKVKLFYESTPDELKPTIRYNSRDEFSFPTIGSKIFILPSSTNVARGYMLHGILVTELPFWEKAEEKMISLTNAVPPDKGQIIVESTPKGAHGLFYRMWMDDNNGYIKKRYGWWWHYSKEEIEVIRKSLGDPLAFDQEYCLAFLQSGRSVFDQETIDAQQKTILNIGDETPISGLEGEKRTYIVNKDADGIKYYQPAIPGHSYVLGADTSEGVRGGDFSAAIIFDRTTGEEVAFFRGLLSPDKFGDLLNKLGRKYNDALLVVEVNNHGLTTLTILKQLLYPSLYFRPSKFESPGSPISEKIGWRTTKMNRDLLIDDFAQIVREGSITLHSKELMQEMTTFVYDDFNRAIPSEGSHDDTIFAASVCMQGFKMMTTKPVTQLNYEDYLPQNFSY